jgi:hypothetical protein
MHGAIPPLPQLRLKGVVLILKKTQEQLYLFPLPRYEDIPLS